MKKTLLLAIGMMAGLSLTLIQPTSKPISILIPYPLRVNRLAPIPTVPSSLGITPIEASAEQAAVVQTASAPVEQPAPEPQPSPDDFYINYIFQKESSNRLDAVNPIGACGLAQALPCSKLSSACPNWQTDRDCQVQWFTQYALARYGSWAEAYSFWLSHSWW